MLDDGSLIFAIFIAISLSACCGLRAFLPPFIIGLLGMTGHITLAAGFDWLSRPEVVLGLGLATALEIVADKFPGLDHALDAAGVVIKPLAATLLTTSLIQGMDPALSLTLGLVLGGSIAGTTHVAKAKLRLFSTGLTGGMANPALSAAEDATTLAGTALGIVAPVITGVIVIGILVWLVRKLLHRRRRTAESVL